MAPYCGGLLLQEAGRRVQNQKECYIYRSEYCQVMGNLIWQFFYVKFQRDQAGQRGDRRAQASEVRPEKERFPVGGETGEKHRSRHIADQLTRQRRKQHRIPAQNLCHKAL